jgi:membrane associated rhomboid family serine protease
MSTRRSLFNFNPRTLGPATKALCIATLVISVVSQITQQRLGIGIANLDYSVRGILSLELWRLVTYPFIYTNGLSLLIGIVVLYFVGGAFETQNGTRDYLRFFAFAALGAGVIAIPLHFVIELIGIFRDIGQSVGSGPAVDAMLMAWALTAPDSNILMGFVLPVRMRTAIIALLAIQVIYGIMDGASALSLTLGGLAMGYLLVTGIWRPSRWFSGRRRSGGRVRNGLYIVPPRRDDTLH